MPWPLLEAGSDEKLRLHIEPPIGHHVEYRLEISLLGQRTYPSG